MKRRVRNFQFKKVIVVSFGIFILLTAVLGSISVLSTRKISGRTEILYNRPHTNLIGMMNVKAKISETGSRLKEAILQRGELPGVIAENTKEIPELIASIEANKVDPSAPMSDNMKAIVAAIEEWTGLLTVITDALESGTLESLSNEDYTAYNQAEEKLLNKMDSIIETARENALLFRNESVKMADRNLLVMAGLFTVATIFCILALIYVLRSFSVPMDIILNASKEMAQGNLHTEIAYESKNEFGVLISHFREMKEYLRSVVEEIDDLLHEMAQGNFDIKHKIDYIGDFSPILTSLQEIHNNLSYTLSEINESAEQVSAGADQMSSGAQLLSNGAVDQAASIQELSSYIQTVSGQIEQNARNAKETNQGVTNLGRRILENSRDMQDMIEAMEDINEKSREINNIIKTIEDIAFETNILSLNASIEAARAGSFGKSFAVVAEEVKALADRSGEEAKNTTALIESCIQAVDRGVSLADKTAGELKSVADDAGKITERVEEITRATNEQADASGRILDSVEQISEVVQSNSATAEETAASSEELNAQAATLRGMVERFRFQKVKKTAVGIEMKYLS